MFGALGRFSAEKRIDRALQAFRAVVEAESGRPMFLVLIGFGPDEASLHRLAADLEIADRCIWPGESLTPWLDLPGFDCYLLTSDTEGLPYSLMEAMACERVAVAVDTGGVGEVLSGFGVLTAPAAPEVGAAMLAVSSWPAAERSLLGLKARQHVAARYDGARQIGAVAALIGKQSLHSGSV